MTLSWKWIHSILLAWDPIGLYYEDVVNLDEYDHEARYIASRLPSCKSRRAVRELIFNHLVAQFGRTFAFENGKAKRCSKSRREEIEGACKLGLRRHHANRIGDLVWSLMVGRPKT